MSDTNNQQERPSDRAWLAGIWEGEGTFAVYHTPTKWGKRYWPLAQCVNTDFVLIEEIHAALERNNIGHRIVHREMTRFNPKHKDTKVVWIYGMKRVQALIRFILPELRGKKKEVAQTVLEFIEYRLSTPQPRGKHGYLASSYSSKDEDYYQRLKALNKKGPSESSETLRQTTFVEVEDKVQVAASVLEAAQLA
jgi:hypothetical protein